MRVKQIRLQTVAVLVALFGATLFLLSTHAPKVSATINPQINFQGKLTNPDGTNVTDGNYSIVFSIYSVASGGTAIWTETQSSVAVSSGVFQVSLGSVNTTLATAVNFNSSPLYLGVKVGSDAEMTPRITFTAAPYALNADKLGGINSSGYIQLGSGSVQNDATTNPSVFLNKTGASGNILQLQKGGVDQFVVANSGAATFSNTVNIQSTAYTSNQLFLNNGQTTPAPAYPNAYLPTLAIRVAQANGSRPLFFGYDNGAGTGYAAFLTAGACGAFTNMCLDLGNGAVAQTALENVGTTLNIGGGDDGNFANINFANSGTATFGSATAFNGATAINSGTANGLSISSSTSVPTADQVVIDNTASTGVTTAGVNGLDLHYKGGAAAVEAAGLRLDYTPGTTSGGTWSGLRVVENTPSSAGVTSYGLKLESGGAGAGNSYGVEVGTGWDIGVDVQSGGLQLASQTDPAAPSAGNLRIYAKTIAGRVMPKWIGPSGVDTPFQASFGFNRIAMMTPQNGTTATTIMTEFGGGYTNSAGTYATPALASTNLATSVRRARLTTVATAGSIAYHLPAAGMVWRGNAAGLGGFFYTTRFTVASTVAANRGFVGLVDNAGTAPTNVDPTTTTTPGKLGLAFNNNTGNLKWVNNTSGTAPAITDLGTNFAVNNAAALYELVIFSPPNGSTVTYRVTNITTGSVTSDTVVNTNLPASTSFLAPEYWISNQGTGTAISLDNAGWYLESDN